MAQSRKEKLNYRCPSCFMRDLDFDMWFDPQREEYYCLRCNFSAKEDVVLKLNEKARFRYRLMNQRITKFAPKQVEKKMIKGMDVSTLLNMQENDIKYFDFDNQEIQNILEFSKQYGVESVRLRLWVDPYSEDGIPYEGGTLSLERFIETAKILRDAGFSIMLDFHFSDFWVDPGKQTLPKRWKNLNFEQLKVTLADYIDEVLENCAQNQIEIAYIQAGNEITNGMLWPHGKLYEGDQLISGGYQRLAELLNVATKQIRSKSPASKIILHLERSGDSAMYQEWFANITERGVDFDIIGLSYYPFYHGTFEQLGKTIDVCHSFGYPTMIVETGYVYTTKAAPNTNMKVSHLEDGYVPFPYTEDGQATFIKRVGEFAKEKNIQGVYYWEPLWLPGKNVNWSSHPGRVYINEAEKEGGNEWSNHALFSYEGKAHKGWHEIKKL